MFLWKDNKYDGKEEKNDLYNKITEIELILDNYTFVEENVISVKNAILNIR